MQHNIFSQENITDYCRGKSWIIRFPIVLFLLYIFYQHAVDTKYFGLLGNFNLIMHEAGHWIFVFFGETIRTLGGTLLQFIVPLVCLLAFLFQREYFEASFCLGWISDNLFGIAAYIADARARILPLLGDNVDGHDWYNLLGGWGLLNYGTAIAGCVKFFAVSFMSTAILFGLLLLWKMHYNKKAL